MGTKNALCGGLQVRLPKDKDTPCESENMSFAPDGITVGDELSQEEIEEAFETGFGYQISGINPRRDDQDRRYILVFANEDGPYDDSVKHGRFEYVGEGLSGDQKESSPGNSALIDAISSEIPVHFFYKEHEGPGWEYQGLVHVRDRRFEEREGRQVIVFTMEHRQRDPSMNDTNGLYLIPVNDEWRDEFRHSVESPLDLTAYEEIPPQLEGATELRIWGTTETDASKKQTAIDQMESGDSVLFYHDGDFIAGGRVRRTFENPDVGRLLWNEPKSRHIFTIDDFTTEVPPIERVWSLLGYEGRQVVQGFTRVSDKRISELVEDYESMSAALFGLESQEPSEEEIEEAKSELEQAVYDEPKLTEDEEEFTESKRRARDSAFSRLVKEAYANTCAVCGSSRETPDGKPEVEAAHIYPKEKNGRDDVRNGIALCRLHHWAFDSGWLSLTDDYEILVSETPNRDGYYEFKQLERDSVQLPSDESAWPDSCFLEKHRELHGFISQ